jgi:exodeoxyribonuclease V alpha subunit
MIALYQQAIACGALRALDVQFALTISQQDPAIMLAAACLSAQSGAGHVCLSLEQLHPQQLFDGRFPALAEALSATLDDAQTIEWRERLLQHPAVSDGSRPSPLVLVEQRLYLQRMWQSEREVAAFLHTAACQDIANVVDDESLREILDRLFGNAVPGDIDWQKVAAAVAVTRRLAIISGGPGTGKTTTVAKLLAALLQLMPETALRIQMAAPTGKAAARLTSSLGQATAGLALDETLRQRLPNEAFTLHRLLGAQGSSLRMRYHKENPLHLDVLVVDEASMVDLPMMARLIDALPAHARLILLGDRDQLASVEAGAVLGDICRFAEQGYSADRAAQLTRQTGYPVQGNIQGSSAIADSLCLLRKSYRFSSASGIGTLATAVNCGDVFAARAVLSQPRDRDISPICNWWLLASLRRQYWLLFPVFRCCAPCVTGHLVSVA